MSSYPKSILRSTAAVFTFAFITSTANASTFTMVDCLSANGTSDVTVHLKEGATDAATDKVTEFGRVFSRSRGALEEIKGQVKEYTASRFLYTGKAGKRTLSVDVDLNSVESNNGTVTIDSKVERAQCFVTDTQIQD